MDQNEPALLKVEDKQFIQYQPQFQPLKKIIIEEEQEVIIKI
jgi:hypothetical protein